MPTANDRRPNGAQDEFAEQDVRWCCDDAPKFHHAPQIYLWTNAFLVREMVAASTSGVAVIGAQVLVGRYGGVRHRWSVWHWRQNRYCQRFSARYSGSLAWFATVWVGFWPYNRNLGQTASSNLGKSQIPDCRSWRENSRTCMGWFHGRVSECSCAA